MRPAIELPPRIAPDRLADMCREAAVEARVQPSMVEKDYYLTRLIWGLAQLVGKSALLKGGTLLSKVDLALHRMSEDVDLVMTGVVHVRKRPNALRMNAFRDALLRVADIIGARVRFPHGERTERDAHAQWELPYDSEFGPQWIVVEATIRPVVRTARRVTLKQILVTGEAELAYCWALDELEARAEKVRAAFTRRAIRDYYDLQMLADAGKDLSSAEFVDVVDRKLAELDAPALAHQPAAFGMTQNDRAKLIRGAREELTTVVRIGDPPFDLDAMLAQFDALWGKR